MVTMIQLTERDAIALTIYGEARGEHVEGRIAVGSVLRNRLLTGRWGHTFSEVVQAPYQFSCWLSSDPNCAALVAIAGGAAKTDPVLRECYWIADGILSGDAQSNVKTALSYYAPAAMVPPGRVPAWAAGLMPTVVIGGHLFF